MDDEQKKKKNRFTIIKDDSTDGHGGYGAGVISLENMSSVIVDPNENKAYVDMNAMHARSDVERRVKWIRNKEEVPNGKLYWIVWVNLDRNEQGTYYGGVAASEIRVDREIKRAYKSMGEHVKHMEQSLKGKIVVDHMDAHSKQLLRDYLIDFNEEMWNNSSDELKTAFDL
ncbi:YwhD family protein [Oceanobacillus alkalisoli]|uniref:YwhD family protein n=1 Tax=Oceanobacillus alkalisoli TaxID=2925113 RepID=UPI001EF0FE03|nr:YwhD family protein [Oceanobacillus alkalisoli]MCF3942773.1 YwhD family protein [Oceanobacillus alkalisoli]MCG5102744.1 YwhD family protein [Oceanobacillus alkalisoli]